MPRKFLFLQKFLWDRKFIDFTINPIPRYKDDDSLNIFSKID
jgi:hypothetical protein